MKRFGQVIGVKPEKLAYYKELHAKPWQGVLDMIEACNIRNYSIYVFGDKLFAYYEYTGEDYEADMKKMAADPLTQKWWDECMPCQQPAAGRPEGAWWMDLEEVFHLD
jgi:L-rhamnose mutarotase